MALAETIQTGLNNPECAFFVGSYMGAAWGAKLLFMAYLMYAIAKVLDKIALEPFIAWIKTKMKSK